MGTKPGFQSLLEDFDESFFSKIEGFSDIFLKISKISTAVLLPRTCSLFVLVGEIRSKTKERFGSASELRFSFRKSVKFFIISKRNVFIENSDELKNVFRPLRPRQPSYCMKGHGRSSFLDSPMSELNKYKEYLFKIL